MSGESNTFALRLRHAIEKRGISQTELAAKVEIDRTELNRLVNGKRAPRPREAAWLIEALGVGGEEFLGGLDLAEDPAFADEIEQYRGLARRVLDAERKRDDAQASRNALEESLRIEETAWRAERGQLQAALADIRRDCAGRLKQREEEFARREHELLRELSEARDQLALSQRQLRAANELANERLRQVAELQRSVETERARVMSAGVFGGLVGAMLGGGIGAVVASTREAEDPDDGNDDEDDKERA
ncbi:MAG TPA: helix-turn-helix domain-containing protein [Kofleriaceae bacterium]|jgi:transcriptional regulator with XRE-family HTH domain|nr:helix-turn-helix domain-containing protein [Kofleriaceae bacterium]